MADFNDFNNGLNDVVSGVEPAKKHTGAIVGGITAGVVVLAAGGFAVAYSLSDYVKNQVKLRISKPENYYSWVTEKNSSEFAAQIADSYRTALEEQKKGQKAQISLKYEPSSDAKDMLLEEIGYEENKETCDIINGINDITIGADVSSKDAAISGSFFGDLNGERLSSLDFAVDYNELGVFYRIPELSEQWLTVSEVFDETDMEEIEKKFKKNPEEIITPEELEQLITKYVDLYNNCISDVEIEKKEEIVISDITVNYTVAEITLTADKAKEMATEFLNAFKEDELLKSIAVDRTGAMTAEEYDEALDDALAELDEDDGEENDETAVLKTYIDSRGDIRGIDMSSSSSEGEGLYCIIGKDDSEIRGEANFNFDDEAYSCTLTMSEIDENTYSGSLDMTADGETVKVEFTDISLAGEKKCYVNGNATLYFSDEQELALELISDGNSQQIACDIDVDGTNYGKLTLDVSSENGAEPSIPDKSGAYDVNSDDADFPRDYVEQDVMTAYIKNIFVKVGIDEKKADEYAKSFTDDMYTIRSYDSDYDDFYNDNINGWDDDDDFFVDDSDNDIDTDDYDLGWFDDDEDDSYIDDMVYAKPGQAFIAVIDNDFSASYAGEDGGNLGYGAKNADIKGNGTYTVSLTADSDGYKAASKGRKPNGIYVMGIDILGLDNAENAEFILKTVKVDGKEIEITGQPTVQTSKRDINVMIGLYDNGDFAIDTSDIGEWTDLEITFEIKGL